MLSAAAMAPMVIALSNDRCSRKVLKVATAGAVLGSLIAVGMAYFSRNLDLGWFSLYYLFSGMFSLTVAGALSKVLNSNLARIRRDSFGRA
jgi:high-affinity Fe2+/Pb2+ permease